MEKPSTSGSRFNLQSLLNSFGPFLGLVLVIGFFAMDGTVRPSFLSIANFKIILTQTVIVAIGALGMTLIIVSGGIDLSIGSVVALTSVIGALLVQKGFSLPVVVLAALLSGWLCGAIIGGIVAGARINPFIVTLGMMGIARGTAKWFGQNQTVNYTDEFSSRLAEPGLSVGQCVHDSTVPIINGLLADPDPNGWLPSTGVWLVLGLAIIMALVMRRTVFGRHVFALGSNETTARLCGIRTAWLKASIYRVAGLFFGLAGLMQLARLRQGDPTSANGLELDVIAAVVIGGASLSGGVGSVMGSMIGALIMAVLRNGSNQMEWPNYMQEIIIGAVIIVAVGIDRWRQSHANA